MFEITCVTCGKVLLEPLEMYGPVHLEQCKDCFLKGKNPYEAIEERMIQKERLYLRKKKIKKIADRKAKLCPPTKP